MKTSFLTSYIKDLQLKRLSKTKKPIIMLMFTVLFSFAGVVPANAYSGPANNYACTPNALNSLTENGYAIEALNESTYNICASIPYGTYYQYSGRSQTFAGTWVGVHVQQNTDGYTMLEMWAPGGMYAYWQQNPRDPRHNYCSWFKEEVILQGRVTYYNTGWYCG